MSLKIVFDENPHVSPPDSAVKEVKAVVSGGFVWVRVGKRPQKMLNTVAVLNAGRDDKARRSLPQNHGARTLSENRSAASLMKSGPWQELQTCQLLFVARTTVRGNEGHHGGLGIVDTDGGTANFVWLATRLAPRSPLIQLELRDIPPERYHRQNAAPRPDENVLAMKP
jgi:hypothetical protein